MKHITLFILLFLFLACSSTKNTVKTHTSTTIDSLKLSTLIRTDTVKSIIKTIYIPAVATLNIDNPCDSVGNLKPVNISTKVGNFKASITSIGNNLKIKVQELDSIIQINQKLSVMLSKKDSIIKNTKVKIHDAENTKIIRYRPTKWTYIFLAIALLEAYFIFGNPKKLIANTFKNKTS